MSVAEKSQERLRRLAQAGLSIVAIATVVGFCGGLFWFLDLFAHFRVQYFLSALFLGGALFALRSFRYGWVSLVVAVINLVLLLPFYWGDLTDSPQGQTLTAMLYNVNTRAGSPAAVVDLVQDLHPDVFLLLEIDERWVSELSKISQEYPYRILEPRPDNFGIGLFSKHPISDSEIVYLGTAAVPTILATLETPEEEIQVVATHPLPPIGSSYARQRDEQLQALPGVLSESLPALLLGDLNTTPWGNSFRAMLSESGLLNSMKGFGIQPSWPTGNFLLKIPLDHVLHSEEIKIHDRRLGRNAGSDHLPVLVDFSIREEAEAEL